MADFFTPQKTTHDIWYKEPWMLLVVGGPVIVAIAAIITGYIAWQGEDKVIAKDYYKQGININKDIFRDAKAIEYNMQAKAKFDGAIGKITLQLEGKTALPAVILFSSASRSNNSVYEQIQKVNLTQVQPGKYEGAVNISPATDSANFKLWHVQIEAADWRLTADWRDPTHSLLQMHATY